MTTAAFPSAAGDLTGLPRRPKRTIRTCSVSAFDLDRNFVRDRSTFVVGVTTAFAQSLIVQIGLDQENAAHQSDHQVDSFIEQMSAEVGKKYESEAHSHKRQHTLPAVLEETECQSGHTDCKNDKQKDLIAYAVIDLTDPHQRQNHERERNHDAVNKTDNWSDDRQNLQSCFKPGRAPLRLLQANLPYWIEVKVLIIARYHKNRLSAGLSGFVLSNLHDGRAAPHVPKNA